MEGKVILYSTGCPRCEVLKKKLAEKGVEYTEISDVDKLMELDILTVPVLYVGGEMKDFAKALAWVNSVERGEE